MQSEPHHLGKEKASTPGTEGVSCLPKIFGKSVKDVEDPKNLGEKDFCSCVGWSGFGKGYANVEAFEPLEPISYISENYKITKNCTVRSPVFIHPFLYREAKLIFLRDIGGLARDHIDNKVINQGSMNKAVRISFQD